MIFIPLKKYWENYSVNDEVACASLPYGLDDFFNYKIKEKWGEYVKDVNNSETRLTDAQIDFFSKNVVMRVYKYRVPKYMSSVVQIRMYLQVDEKMKNEYDEFLKRFIG